MASQWRAHPYYRPGLLSLGLHVGLIMLLSVSWMWSSAPSVVQSAPTPVNIIQATAISAQQYEQEVKAIEQAQQRAEQAEKQRQAAAVAAKKREEQRVAEAQRKIEQQKIAEKKLAEEQRLAEQQKRAEEQRKIEEAQAAAEQQKIAEQKKIEEAKKLAEQKQAEALAAEKAAAQTQRKTEEEQLRQQQLAAEQQQLAAQQQTYVAGELDRFKVLITQKISSMWNVPIGADASLEVHLKVRLAPDGSVLSVRVERSSGNEALDQSALDAVRKASPLPVPSDAAVFNEMRDLDIIITPQMLSS